MCVLHVISKTKSFKNYSEKTSIPTYKVVDKNDLKNTSKNKKWGIYRISFSVSNKEWNKFHLQIKDSIKFLKEHKKSLKYLFLKYEVDHAYLDFPIDSRLDKNVLVQNDYIPYELNKLCGDLKISINLSYYSS